jgi:hypothetical protein
MDEKLQRIILEKISEAGGKCEKERLYQNRVIVEYLQRRKESGQNDATRKYHERSEKIDHNLSLLEEQGKVKISKSVPAIMNATNITCELTTVGYKYLDMPNQEQSMELNQKISEIETLKKASAWGPEYKIWKDGISKIIEETFGKRGLNLFNQQISVVLSDEAYRDELDSKRKIIEGLIANKENYPPEKKDKKNARDKEKGQPQQNWIERITNNSTFANIVGTILAFLILGIIFYFIYLWSGINLQNIGH